MKRKWKKAFLLFFILALSFFMNCEYEEVAIEEGPVSFTVKQNPSHFCIFDGGPVIKAIKTGGYARSSLIAFEKPRSLEDLDFKTPGDTLRLAHTVIWIEKWETNRAMIAVRDWWNDRVIIYLTKHRAPHRAGIIEDSVIVDLQKYLARTQVKIYPGVRLLLVGYKKRLEFYKIKGSWHNGFKVEKDTTLYFKGWVKAFDREGDFLFVVDSKGLHSFEKRKKIGDCLWFYCQKPTPKGQLPCSFVDHEYKERHSLLMPPYFFVTGEDGRRLYKFDVRDPRHMKLVKTEDGRFDFCENYMTVYERDKKGKKIRQGIRTPEGEIIKPKIAFWDLVQTLEWRHGNKFLVYRGGGGITFLEVVKPPPLSNIRAIPQ